MKGFIYTAIIIVLLGLISIFVHQNVEAPIGEQPVATTTVPTIPPSNNNEVNAKGEFIMKLYETKTVQGVKVHVWAVTEDSRCPSDVQCIWAGRVRVATHIDTITKEFEIGQSVIVNNKKITLKDVLPYPKQNHKITDDEYIFVFKIENNFTQPVVRQCYVGGCSAQICSDKPDMISTCEWTAAYACYKTATCERQSTGQCGWTQTNELTKCLNEAK